MTAGHLRSTDVAPLRRYYVPLRLPLVFVRLPGCAGYTDDVSPALARWDEEGLSSCFELSLSSCRRFHPAEVARRISRVATLHAAFEANQSSRPSGTSNFEATHAFTLVTARTLAHLP